MNAVFVQTRLFAVLFCLLCWSPALSLDFEYDKNQNQISATGTITAYSADSFREFLKRNGRLGGPWKTVVKLRSEGGALAAALDLGRLIRAHQITVLVTNECLSACVFVLMGGGSRYYEPGAQLGVHQFYSERTIRNVDKKEFTGAEQIAQQILVSRLIEYTTEMGVDPSLIALASRTLPTEMRILTDREIATYKLAARSDEPSTSRDIDERPHSFSQRHALQNTLSGISIGEQFSKLALLGIRPSAIERMGPFQLIKYKFADDNTLSVTLDVRADRVVYIESNWGQSSPGRRTDIPDFFFGETTPHEISEKHGNYGLFFKDRGVISKIDDGFIAINAYKIEGGYVAYISKLQISNAREAARKSVARTARLEGIVVADREYLQNIWGFEAGLIDPVSKGLLATDPKDPKRHIPVDNALERYLMAENTATTVIAAFNKAYSDGGMIKIRSSIEDCYVRAFKLKTQRSSAYCFMLDLRASLLSRGAQQTYGFPLPGFHTIDAVFIRTGKLLDSKKLTPRDKKDFLELWSASITADKRP